jgi:hypothetical protein
MGGAKDIAAKTPMLTGAPRGRTTRVWRDT